MVLTGPVIRRRLAICMAVFLMLFSALSARLFVLQILRAEELQRRAQNQWNSSRPARFAAANSFKMKVKQRGIVPTVRVVRHRFEVALSISSDAKP